VKGSATSGDLVERRFAWSRLNQLWVSDITEHPTRQGKVLCCCVMDTCRRETIGLSVDTVQDSQSVVNARDMAISLPTVRSRGIVHADHGVQFTSWVFSEKGRPAGVIPSFASIGDAFEYSMLEFSWSSIENEIPNRKPGITRIKLSNAIFE
jgi:putative transposase